MKNIKNIKTNPCIGVITKEGLAVKTAVKITAAARRTFCAVLCSIYILISPKINVTGKEHNVFFLQAEEKNALINLNNDTVEISLCRSLIYGSYVYRAKIEGKQIDGNIERDKSLWKRMPLWSKIICCVLSEILIFVWLIGRLIFFLRSINLPKRLEYKMNKNGFTKVGNNNE